MSDSPQPLYPDLLGVITQNKRLNLDVVQAALTSRPNKVAAGQNFEILILLQNASDVDVDVLLELHLPDKDQQGKKGMFFSKSARLLVGLQPAEVGYVVLPASCSPKTTPAEKYPFRVDLKVTHLDKTLKPQRLRSAQGGEAVPFAELSESQRRTLISLRSLSWEAPPNARHSLEAKLAITPPNIAPLRDFKAEWVSLWTLKDLQDKSQLLGRMGEYLGAFLPHLNRAEMLRPLLDATQALFTRAGYPLKPAESIVISKLLTHVLCDIGSANKPVIRQPTASATQTMPAVVNSAPVDPEHNLLSLFQGPPYWYKKLIEILTYEPRLRLYPEKVVKELLYEDLVEDAIGHSFYMLKVLGLYDVGTKSEVLNWAGRVRQALSQNGALDYASVYMPLVLGGVMVNNRLNLRGEMVRDTLHAVQSAHESRRAEIKPEFAFIGDILHGLVDSNMDKYD
jgi:hypothetical protein